MAVDRSWGWQEGFKRKSPSAVQSLPDESEKQKAFFFFFKWVPLQPLHRERKRVCVLEGGFPRKKFLQDQGPSGDSALHSSRG